jgi:hypothetical protein
VFGGIEGLQGLPVAFHERFHAHSWNEVHGKVRIVAGKRIQQSSIL